jgi:hypothetical protein
MAKWIGTKEQIAESKKRAKEENKKQRNAESAYKKDLKTRIKREEGYKRQLGVDKTLGTKRAVEPKDYSSKDYKKIMEIKRKEAAKAFASGGRYKAKTVKEVTKGSLSSFSEV